MTTMWSSRLVWNGERRKCVSESGDEYTSEDDHEKNVDILELISSGSNNDALSPAKF